MDLEEKYKSMIEVYTKRVEKNSGVETENYTHKKSKFKESFEYEEDSSKNNKKRNRKERAKRYI